jgi:predicted dehydrogenase
VTPRDSLIRVGVVGCGYWGPKLARNFTRQRGAEVTVLCDSLSERAAAIADEYRVQRHVTRFEDVTRADDVDLVIVATPSRTHYSIAKDALATGKHVWSPSPLRLGSITPKSSSLSLTARASCSPLITPFSTPVR